MAMTLSGDGTITGLVAGGLPDATITTDELAAGAALNNAPNSVGFRNRIINGDMRIDQRNAGASVSVQTSTTYIIDRWSVLASANSKYTAQQNNGSVTPPAGFTNYFGINVAASANVTVGATDQYLLRQGIEGFNASDLAWGTASAKTVTLSFWVRSSLTGTFGGSLNGGGGGYSYPFSYTISSANTWEYKTITIAGQTAGTWASGNTLFTWLAFDLGIGSTYSGTAGSWANTYYSGTTGATKVIETNSATWYITGVQLEVGSVATPFERRDYGTELVRCQRYFEKSAAIGTAILTANDAGYLTTNLYNNIVNSSYYATVEFKVTKRADPTVTTYPYTTPANTGRWSNDVGTDYGASSATTPNGPKQWGFNVANQSGGTLTVGSQKLIIGNWYADAEL